MHQQTEYNRFLDHLTLRQAISDNQGQNTAEGKWIVPNAVVLRPTMKLHWINRSE